MTDFHAIAGKVAGTFALIGFIPYVWATLKGINKPNRASWMIWFIMGILSLASYQSAGATHTLWVSFANLICIGLIVLLSIKYGEGGWTSLDLTCLFGALLGLALWGYFDSPLPTLYLSIAIDCVGAIPTVKKSYLNPAGEDRLTWLLFWIANTTNLLALEHWTWAMALYPVYLFLISGTITSLLFFSQLRKQN